MGNGFGRGMRWVDVVSTIVHGFENGMRDAKMGLR